MARMIASTLSIGDLSTVLGIVLAMVVQTGTVVHAFSGLRSDVRSNRERGERMEVALERLAANLERLRDSVGETRDAVQDINHRTATLERQQARRDRSDG